jgi:receptor protein-tyrosine kinase
MMSQFFKALERAERERALRQQAGKEKVAAEPLLVPEETLPPPEHGRSEPEGRSLSPQELDGVDPHLVSLLTPTTFESEQYRVLRHLVEQGHQEASLQVIGVTSPGVGDGKTTTAINLAGALSQAPDVRVLLVEADLRRPHLAASLGLPSAGTKGVVDLVLNADLPFEAAVVRLPQYNLAVLPAGRPSPSSYEMLKSPRLSWVFQEAKNRFDYLVVDTSPVIPLPDYRLLQKWLDGCILVVHAHRTSRKGVEESLEVIGPSKLLGLVFNADEQTAARYSSYYSPVNGNGAGWGPKLVDFIRRRSFRLAR